MTETKPRRIRASEEAYTTISNLAKIRAISGVLRDLCVDYEKARQAAVLISEIEAELARRVR